MSQTNVDSENKIMVNCISCGLGKAEKSYAIEVYNYNQIPNLGKDLEIPVQDGKVSEKGDICDLNGNIYKHLKGKEEAYKKIKANRKARQKTAKEQER